MQGHEDDWEDDFIWGKAGRTRIVQLGEVLGGELIHAHKYLMGGYEEGSRLFTDRKWENGHNLKPMKFHLSTSKLFYWDGGQTLEQIAQQKVCKTQLDTLFDILLCWPVWERLWSPLRGPFTRHMTIMLFSPHDVVAQFIQLRKKKRLSHTRENRENRQAQEFAAIWA